MGSGAAIVCMTPGMTPTGAGRQTMDLEEYERRYRVFALSMQQTRLVATVAAKELADFPAGLPLEWRPSVIETFQTIGEQMPAVIAAAAPGPNAKASFTKDLKDLPHADLVIAAISFMMDGSLLGPGEHDPVKQDFTSVVYAQMLTLSFAHASAFVADSGRAICHARPGILKCDRKLDWRTIIEAGDWNAVFSTIVDDFVYAFGWDSIRKCVEEMCKRFGLKLDITDEMMRRIDDAELLRNLIVHAGGRVSTEYIRRSGRADVALGQKLSVDMRAVSRVWLDILVLGGQLFRAVAETHLGAVRGTITGIWVRPEACANEDSSDAG